MEVSGASLYNHIDDNDPPDEAVVVVVTQKKVSQWSN